ncbi:MAG TPA: hypothetical protein PLA16_10260 [Chitinophagales bacterium]|nr:hypothetical protein [Chitinophagales bacterium]
MRDINTIISIIFLKEFCFGWWGHQPIELKGYANLPPNQSILSSSDDSRLAVNDFVFTHPWEGDGMLCFSRLLLYRNGKITGEWATYDGGN